MSNTFGQVIRTRRKQHGLTIEQVAKRTGTHKGYISGIEGSKVNPPTWRMTQKLAKVLDLDALDLIELGWSEKAPGPIRDRVRTRLQQDNPLYLATIKAPAPVKPEMEIPSRPS